MDFKKSQALPEPIKESGREFGFFTLVLRKQKTQLKKIFGDFARFRPARDLSGKPCPELLALFIDTSRPVEEMVGLTEEELHLKFNWPWAGEIYFPFEPSITNELLEETSSEETGRP